MNGDERGGEEPRARVGGADLQASVEVGHLLFPQQQVGRQQRHDLAFGDALACGLHAAAI